MLNLYCLHTPTRRYNVYQRVKTLMKRVTQNKKVKLAETFLPKRKRVLNKRARVLNKPAKDEPTQRKDTAPARPKLRQQTVDDILNSQCSISTCFFDSQGRFPPCTVWVALK